MKRATTTGTACSNAPQFALVDQDRRFELLLDLYVDGLARRAER
jgi:hypothetical protein